jgi:hypothetical protein
MLRISLLIVLALMLGAWTHGMGAGALGFLFGAPGGNCNSSVNQCLLDNSGGRLQAQ